MKKIAHHQPDPPPHGRRLRIPETRPRRNRKPIPRNGTSRGLSVLADTGFRPPDESR